MKKTWQNCPEAEGRISDGKFDGVIDGDIKSIRINDWGGDDRIIGEKYRALIDYAFEEFDYFMLVYTRFNDDDYRPSVKKYRETLKEYEVKIRHNMFWPGTPGQEWLGCEAHCDVVFYRCDPSAKNILKEADGLSSWCRPEMPEDLCFFKGDSCRLVNTAHENIANIVCPTKRDIEVLPKMLDLTEENFEYCFGYDLDKIDEAGLSKL